MQDPGEKKGEGQTDWYTYIELAKLLIPYVKKNHYTHIEMMPLSEHPLTDPGDIRIPDFLRRPHVMEHRMS